MKKLSYFLVPLFLIIIFITVSNYPRLNIITGFSAKSVCSCTFEADRDLRSIEAGDNGFSPINLAKNVINEKEKSVVSTIFGLKARKAIYKEGVGCVLLPNDIENIKFKPNRTFLKNKLPYPYGDATQKDTVFSNLDYDALQNAVDNAFDKNGEQLKRTRAVVVIYKGQIIAEKYAEGFSKDTKLLGWSMTKSITNAVLGVLEKQGNININQINLFPEWENDERSKITLNNLLQMNSGLEWVEDYNTISDVTKMLFLADDMTRTQLNKPLTGKPNESWNYSSGTTNLLSGFVRNQFKTHQEYLDFWYTELIDKIGMSSMIVETDATGNYIGSSYGWATARDWAKFGLLYLNEGNWNGEQILNKSWVNYSKTPTNTSNGEYGAQFWLNAGGVYSNVPKDLFSCNGYQGQYVFIIPSKDLVIVRFGLTENPEFNVDAFLSEVISSFQ
ncbi:MULTISPECIES: serine hydrolase domain-containing protein [Flavobacteriaceae]|uniref:Class C beta-lactamase-related serine hydrolase n=2 Tax=Flavobacteriaceae TaxID=49546 RepID=A0A4Y8ARF1_9FLAO|nr:MULTISPECIES: serine hydrolase [Flavobacteriaceae]TEW73734.1 class C beta-lactamase-related serine hydrolase [Gramella jeungdoensis]GGK37102.1 serine hydrolase [Lutibacter litoralis]